MESNKMKGYSIALALIIGGTVVAPVTTTVFAAENVSDSQIYNLDIENQVNNWDTEFISSENERILDMYNSKAINSIANESLNEFKLNSDNGHIRVKRGAASIATKLIKKFGKRYLTHELPKMIYKKLPAVITKKVSESAFLGGWNTYILMGPLDEVKDTVTDWLVDQGVWKWAANSAGYIAQGVVWAII